MTRRYPYPWFFWTKKKEKNENGEGTKKQETGEVRTLALRETKRLYNYAVSCCLIETLKFQYLTVGIFLNNQ